MNVIPLLYRSTTKTIWLILVGIVCCVLITSCKTTRIDSGNSKISDFKEELFSFPVNGEKQILTGTLTIPKGFNSQGKAIILVIPPGASSQNYNGLYANLAKELSRNGIAVLRYDSRQLADTILSFESVTMFDQADDAESAYIALKKDKRFGSFIGLLGHSEGGNSVAVVAARNKNISFVVLLSSLGISGVQFQLQNVRNKMEKMADLVQITQNKALDTVQNNLIYSQIEKIHTIIAKNRNIDSMYNLLKKQNEHFYEKYHKQYPKIFGTATIDVLNKRDSTRLLNPHIMTLFNISPNCTILK